jgi:hypothetical protein
MLNKLSNRLFWDVNPQSLDLEKDIALIISRVVERGTLEEWKVIVEAYGLSRIVEVAKEIRSLDIMAANFLAQISDTPINQFKCYNFKQSSQVHWIS